MECETAPFQRFRFSFAFFRLSEKYADGRFFMRFLNGGKQSAAEPILFNSVLIIVIITEIYGKRRSIMKRLEFQKRQLHLKGKIVLSSLLLIAMMLVVQTAVAYVSLSRAYDEAVAVARSGFDSMVQTQVQNIIKKWNNARETTCSPPLNSIHHKTNNCYIIGNLQLVLFDGAISPG